MDNGTVEVATSLGAVAAGAGAGILAGVVAGPAGGVIGALAGAVAGGLVGRWIGRLIVRPRRARTLSLGELLEIATRGDTDRKVK